MEFLRAVTENNVDKARQCLQSGIDVNNAILWNAKDTFSPLLPANVATQPELREELQQSFEYRCRPLNIAVIGGHADMVRLLLSAGADINLKDGRGRTALLCAIYGLDLDVNNINPTNLPLISQTHKHHFDIMKNILLSHPNIYACTLDSPQYEIKGITPLCMASYLCKKDIIQLLLEDGRVNVDGTDSKNATALMYAARDNNVDIVKILLQFGASPDLTDNHGWSAIQYAQGRPEIIQLCEDALRRKRADSTHPFHHNHRYAIHYTKLSFQIATMPSFPSSLSHIQFDTLRDVRLLDSSAAPLVQAMHAAFIQSIRTHNHHALQTLLLPSPPLQPTQRNLFSSILVNTYDAKNGMSALHYAIRAKPIPSLDTIILLYQSGADINAQTHLSRTALHHLARFGVDKDGKSWGIQKPNKMGKKNGKRRMRVDSHDPSVTVNTTVDSDQVQENRLSVQSAPSTTSVSSSIVTISGTDPFHPETRHLLAAPTVQQHLALCVSLLIRLGALVNIADPAGNTPLHFAAEFGGVPEVIEALIEGNADLTLKNKKGLTPLDVCCSEDIRKHMIELEQKRKTSLKTHSLTSNLSGHQRSLEGGDTHSLLSRSVSQSTMKSHNHRRQNELRKRVNKWMQKEHTNGNPDTDSLMDAFERILHVFYCYQTTFTSNIETALGEITDTILNNWNTTAQGHENTMSRAQKTMAQLRYDLREAHDMFDVTDQSVERVMLHYREALEEVEQNHQADADMGELQADKIEKLLDVFERIDSRFVQLQVDQDELIEQVEQLRKMVVGRLERAITSCDDNEFENAIDNLSQTLLILDTIEIDPVLYPQEDRYRLRDDVGLAVDKMLSALKQRELTDTLMVTKEDMEKNWTKIYTMLSKVSEKDVEPLSVNETSKIAVPASVKTTHSQKQMITAKLYARNSSDNNNTRTLNELELAFELFQANLYEVQKELDEVNQQMAQITTQKRKMYETCLSLENELAQQTLENGRTEAVVRSELEQVMACTQKLFDQQALLKTEWTSLRKELVKIESQLNDTRNALRQVRPPLLLQGLLERLEVDEGPVVRVEKDWKEDTALVTEIYEDKKEDDHPTESTTSISTKYLEDLRSRFALQCLMTRLDASLYCLKILARHQIGRARQILIEVQASLTQATVELDDTKARMNALYDDAAEVAHQVFTLKTELETIIRHRKEEIVKVWEVVNEVSGGIEASAVSQQPVATEVAATSEAQDRKNDPSPQKKQDQERQQWIILELEQLQNVHDNLQEAIEDLEREQEIIGQNLQHLATELIEPQIQRLVGQDNVSLLAVSDCLAELMDRIRHRELGVFPLHLADTVKTSRKSIHRLSVATQDSIQSARSLKGKSISSVRTHRTEKKQRLSVVTTSSFTSFSSHQQEHMLSRASALSSAYSRSRSSIRA